MESILSGLGPEIWTHGRFVDRALAEVDRMTAELEQAQEQEQEAKLQV